MCYHHRVTTRPQRIVSLVPSITETLFAFGLGAAIVGVTDYCTHPPDGVATKVRVGGTKNPDLSQIISLQPDLVILNVEENRKPDADALRAADIPLHINFPKTVREGLDSLRELARVTGSEPAAQPIIDDFERALAETERVVASRPRVRVFCPIWKDPYMTINGDTYIGDMLATCGGINIFHDRLRQFPLAAELGRAPALPDAQIAAHDRRYPRVSLAEAAALQPDVILLPDEPYAFSENDLPDFAPFAQARVHFVDGKDLSWWGPRSADALRRLCTLLAPAGF